MPDHNNPVERISHHLKRMEERQQRRKRRRWVVLSLSIMLLGLAGATMIEPTPRKSYRLRLVSADTLSMQRVASLFRESTIPLVIAHYALDTTTITNLYEYQTYSQRLAEVVPAPDTTPERLPSFVVSVSGAKRVGEWLTYQITPFDTAYGLVLDMGNGIVRPMQQSTLRYAYPLPGHFELRLLRQTADSVQVLEVIKYEILPTTPASVTADWQPKETANAELAIQPLPAPKAAGPLR